MSNDMERERFDTQVSEAIRAYVQAGKRGCGLQEAMRCALEAARATPIEPPTAPTTAGAEREG